MAVDLLNDVAMPAPPAERPSARLERDFEAAKKAWHDAVMNLTRCIVELKGLAHNHQRQWQRIIRAVVQDQTAAAQAVREPALESLEAALRELRITHDFAVRMRKVSPDDCPNPDELLEDMVALQKLKTDVFDRWHTVEDLERLAVEHYPITRQQMRQVATKYGPPPSWFEGEEEILW